MSLVMVLIASLIGSPHCAGMCGGFVALCSHGEKPVARQCFYHLGRLCTYITLGVAAGFVGAQVNELGMHLGVPQIAGYITGILLIGAGITSFFVSYRSQSSHQDDSALIQIKKKLLPNQSRVVLYPWSIGVFSTLLPCGWLYTYVVVAAGTGSISESVLTMVFFWIGTLPVLITVGSLAHLFVSPLAKVLPVFASILMVAAGCYSLYTHYAHQGHDHGHHHDHSTMHHHGE